MEIQHPCEQGVRELPAIRELSARLGLPTEDKPQVACLSSRIPCIEPVTPEKVSMIERAENGLQDLGFHDVRVGHHELSSNFKAHSSKPAETGDQPGTSALARSEVGPAEMTKFLGGDTAAQVVTALREIGYAHVTLDLEGLSARERKRAARDGAN